MGVKIKICGLTRQVDMDYLLSCPPDFAGFVFWKKSRRYVDFDRAQVLSSYLRDKQEGAEKKIRTVGVFVDEERDLILRLAGAGVIDLIQLHGNETKEDIAFYKRETGLPVIKAVRVEKGTETDEWMDSEADFLLLDSGMGSGRSFNWKGFAGKIEKPFFLAGGIGPDNMKEAVDIFKPYALDMSSSLESGGYKDMEKIKAVMELAGSL